MQLKIVEWLLGQAGSLFRMNTPQQQAKAPSDGDAANKYYEWEATVLRQSIVASVDQMHKLEQYAVAAIGAVWAWLATHDVPHAARFVWWVPTIFAVLGFVRVLALLRSVTRTAAYMQRIESHICKGAGPGGWEQYLKDQPHIVSLTMKSVWIALLIVTIAVAFVATCTSGGS